VGSSNRKKWGQAKGARFKRVGTPDRKNVGSYFLLPAETQNNSLISTVTNVAEGVKSQENRRRAAGMIASSRGKGTEAAPSTHCGGNKAEAKLGGPRMMG